MRKFVLIAATFTGFVALLGCSSSGGSSGQLYGTGGAGTGGGSGAGNGSGTGATGGLSIDAGSGGSGNGTGACDDQGIPDFDNDGFTVAEGDCNNCDPNVNPGAYDTLGNNVDEDCNGVADDTIVDCDHLIPDVQYGDPMAAAQAIGLCHVATAGDRKWGVLEAKYVKANGAEEPINSVSHGLVEAWGPNVNVQQGTRMLALSSGAARQPTDPGYQSPSGYDTGIMGTAPNGFPIDSPACSVQTANDKTTYNPIGFEIKIRVPTNAKSFKYNFDFYTYEFPVYVCTQFNDFFVALQDPPPPNAQFGNISFDAQNNPVSVNNGFLEVCQPQVAGGKNFPCQLGPAQLQGTGFEGHAATGWLETQSPVTPGSEITLRFAIWDMGDPILDSTVLIDNFQFSAEDATEPGTKPVPVPQ
jgi:hypothetical protein